MLWSNSFIFTSKEIPQEAETLSHQLMLRAGLVRMLMAGVYSYLPLGFKVLQKVEGVIRQEMNACGANELLLSALQPMELWARSGRDKTMAEVMFKFIDRRGRNLSLGPTHEEVITELVRSQVSSYRQLPLILYQIQTKFRDEMRPRFGLIRACEFIMKDAYSFDRDKKGLDKNYQAMFLAYNNIFKRCGLDTLTVTADSGVMGGDLSHEFMVPAESGEDVVWLCPACHKASSYKEEHEKKCPVCAKVLQKINTIEIGHIFKLGTKYSAVLGANFLDSDGKQYPVIMGCYGIGVSRMLPTIIEQNRDADGIIWPKEISPFEVTMLTLDGADNNIAQCSSRIYEELISGGIDVLWDNRDERAGVKFKDADLIGIPLAIIIGAKNLVNNKIEIKVRKTKESVLVDKEKALSKIKEMLNRI
jgi:prolyl-tRNA synthetase